ncbi:MAG TPA: hypothetical protein PKX07_12035, partial [Aggregatilineales bacterium]|nr:hypothetical protein [Aggregatilineales bacterium]
MFSIVEKRRVFYVISAVIILLGFALMVYSTVTTGAPFRLSIDFVGGTIYEIAFTDRSVTEGEIRDVFSSFGDDVLIQRLGDSSDTR